MAVLILTWQKLTAGVLLNHNSNYCILEEDFLCFAYPLEPVASEGGVIHVGALHTEGWIVHLPEHGVNAKTKQQN